MHTLMDLPYNMVILHVQYVFSYMIIFKKILHLKKKNILMRYTKAKAI